MKRLTLGLLAVAAALAITPAALADTVITGSIGLSSDYFDSWNATTFTLPVDVHTSSARGNLTAIPTSTAATGVPSLLTFASTAGEELFVATSGGNTVEFVFDTPLTVVSDSGGNITLSGEGTLALTGYLSTLANITITSTDSSGEYGSGPESSADLSLSINSLGIATPEPSSLLLLGTGLLGLAGVTFRKAKPVRKG
jgi:hypothetical protein